PRRGRCLLRDSRARFAARSLGQPAISPAREPLRPGKSGRLLHGALQYRRRPTTPALVGFPRDPAIHGVLARPTLPSTRQGGVLARTGTRNLGSPAPLSLRLPSASPVRITPAAQTCPGRP